MVYNQLISGDFKLTVDELYVYSYLFTKRTYEEEIETSIDILNAKVKLSSSARYNKENIKKALERLAELQLISIVEEGKALTITFNVFDALEANGFTKVAYDKFKELNPTELYIYAAVARWETSPTGPARYTFEDWAEILSCGRTKAVADVKAAEDKKVIYIKSGKRKEGVKQEVNTYSIAPLNGNEQPNPNHEVEEESAVVEPVEETEVEETVEAPKANEIEPKNVPQYQPQDIQMFDIEAALAAEGLNFNS